MAQIRPAQHHTISHAGLGAAATGRIPAREISLAHRGVIFLDDVCRSLMKSAMSQLQLSARAYLRVLKLSRTIADLAGAEVIAPAHLAEAILYRPRDGELK